jgi:hypothetical protein
VEEGGIIDFDLVMRSGPWGVVVRGGCGIIDLDFIIPMQPETI